MLTFAVLDVTPVPVPAADRLNARAHQPNAPKLAHTCFDTAVSAYNGAAPGTGARDWWPPPGTSVQSGPRPPPPSRWPTRKPISDGGLYNALVKLPALVAANPRDHSRGEGNQCLASDPWN